MGAGALKERSSKEEGRGKEMIAFFILIFIFTVLVALGVPWPLAILGAVLIGEI